MSNNKGFTLVELIISMGIFIGLMLIISNAFENIISKGGQQIKSAETHTEGIIGLEMLRSDLEHAGYGLPWTYPTPTPSPTIDETSDGAAISGITPSSFDETDPPKAIMVGANSADTRYLVIKSTRVALNDTVQRWSYVNYSSQTGTNRSYVKRWGATDDDFNPSNDRVVTISSSFTSAGEPDRRLVIASAGSPNYYYTIPNTTPIFPPAAYQPGDGSQLYVVYGVEPGSAAALRMPYNRADYYVKRPTVNMPQSCNPGTGILYKGVVQHSDGAFAEYPLLNCVGDMQVEFELDRNNDGNIAYSPDLTDSGGTALVAGQIRSQLKTARVYILAHEGKKDRNYSYPKNTIQVGDPARASSSGRTLDSDGMLGRFGADWRNYRWKVYTIVVRPKNLN